MGVVPNVELMKLNTLSHVFLDAFKSLYTKSGARLL